MACSGPARHAVVRDTPEGPRITQYYATKARVPRGETALLCYGVENAANVWMEPPRRQLSAALARCVEVTPQTDTAYKLTAEGAEGSTTTRELTIAVGAPAAHIVNVNVNAVELKVGELAILCYQVENARSVTVDPLKFHAGGAEHGCVSDRPAHSTTYTVTATGAAGDQDQDQERVTVSVK